MSVTVLNDYTNFVCKLPLEQHPLQLVSQLSETGSDEYYVDENLILPLRVRAEVEIEADCNYNNNNHDIDNDNDMDQQKPQEEQEQEQEEVVFVCLKTAPMDRCESSPDSDDDDESYSNSEDEEQESEDKSDDNKVDLVEYDEEHVETESASNSSDVSSCSLIVKYDADGNEQNPLDRLERVCTVGTGTFGRVILCRQKATVKQKHCALKVMPIETVVRTKQVEHVHSEKRILELVDHAYIVKLFWTHHDTTFLYMLFEYVPGGELFSYLHVYGAFANDVAMFYAAEIVCALEYLHSISIVYRDLKPENLLLDSEGHLRLTDFGFAKKLIDRTWTLCGTPEYMAPEIIENRGHNKAVDWWALGVLIYEMMVGHPPFAGDNPLDIYSKVLEGRPRFPKQFDLCAKDLVRKMLVADRTKRLGNMKHGAADVKNHKWFQAIDWDDISCKKVLPPIVPNLAHDGDPGNFDEYDEEDPDLHQAALESEIALFANW